MSTLFRVISDDELKALLKQAMVELLDEKQIFIQDVLKHSTQDGHRRDKSNFSKKEDYLEEQETLLLTRKEASKFLGISLVSLHNWSVAGIIQSYRIGTRIRYKKDELKSAVQEVQNLKHKRRST